MANFGKLDENNIVIEKFSIDDRDIIDENGKISIDLGIKFCQDLFNDLNSKWVFCDCNENGKICGDIGYTYDEENDKFIRPRIFPSWNVYDHEKNEWIPPRPKPEDTKSIRWYWDENSLSWKSVTLPITE